MSANPTRPVQCPTSPDGHHQIDLDSVHAHDGADPSTNPCDIDARCALCGAAGYVTSGVLPLAEDWEWMEPTRDESGGDRLSR
jgi:hypothetical protein